MNQVVLFISHIINEESIFRYGLLKQATDKLGYDLYWCIDNTKPYIVPEQLKDCSFYQFSYDDYSKRFPFIIYNKCNIHDDYNNAVNGCVMSFAIDNPGKYDYIWIVEYDVCLYGDWVAFFEKYSDSDSDYDLITSRIRKNTGRNWYHFRKLDANFLDKLFENKYLTTTLNCLCRISFRLIEKIFHFSKDINNGTLFYEWVWSTVAKMNGMQIYELKSNRFGSLKMENPEQFEDYVVGTPYHAIKLDCKWSNILARLKNINEDEQLCK